MTINKYFAVAVVIILLLLAYFYYTYSLKKGKNDKKEKLTGKGKNTKAKKNKKYKDRGNKNKDQQNKEENESEGDDDLERDAEELYNLVHDGLCKGMQQDDFTELSGDLAGGISFIELKQLYNQCLDSGKDPMKTINVGHYIKILKKEDAS